MLGYLVLGCQGIEALESLRFGSFGFQVFGRWGLRVWVLGGDWWEGGWEWKGGERRGSGSRVLWDKGFTAQGLLERVHDFRSRVKGFEDFVVGALLLANFDLGKLAWPVYFGQLQRSTRGSGREGWEVRGRGSAKNRCGRFGWLVVGGSGLGWEAILEGERSWMERSPGWRSGPNMETLRVLVSTVHFFAFKIFES